MEHAGFANRGVSGEYSQKPVNVMLATDQTRAVNSYLTLLSTSITTESTADIVAIYFTASGDTTNAGGATLSFQITVDGAFVAGTWCSWGLLGCVSQYLTVTGLTPGPHTITVDWKANNAVTMRILAASNPNHHASLALIRHRASSNREMDGYPTTGWPLIYTENVSYAAVTSSIATNSTTPSALLTTTVPTRQWQGALLIRTSFAGLSGAAGPAGVRVRIVVDGTIALGSEAVTVTGGAFCGEIACIAPVPAGNHIVRLDWAATTGGVNYTIDPTNNVSHANLVVEETYCPTSSNALAHPAVNIGVMNVPYDSESYPVQNFAARFLPLVTYKTLLEKISSISTTYVTVLSVIAQIAGDNSAVLIEVTGSPNVPASGTGVLFKLVVDGVDIMGCNGSLTTSSCVGVAMVKVMNLCAGGHTVEVQCKTSTGTMNIDPLGNVPSMQRDHLTLVVRELASV